MAEIINFTHLATHPCFKKQKTPYWEFFVGVASYLKGSKISSLVSIFVHSSALIDAPLMLGPALGMSSRPLIAFYGYPSS
ncbi:MAG: hypothetical protein HY505_02680 [Candidatus Yanofskybacteria bacterium]|nr:hypothetical protein [Candidatus Yanofskybacteria bacterium]